MQALSAGRESSLQSSEAELKRSVREELRRLIHESSVVIARDRLCLLDVVGRGLAY